MTEQKIDPNTVDAQALQTITGIGPATAGRIIAARPFTGPDDLLRVAGISESFLDKIRDRLIFESAPDPEAPPAEESSVETGSVAAPEEEEEPTAETDETETPEEPETAPIPPEKEQKDEEETETEGEKPASEEKEGEEAPPMQVAPPTSQPAPKAEKTPRYITRGQAFWMAASTSFFAFILAVSLTLAVLSALNNGLRFARPDQVRSVQAEVDGLQGQQDTLTTDLDGLRTRMDNFEALGGRVTTLEGDVDDLRTDLEAVSGEIENLSTEITGLSETVDDLVTRTGRFQTFLEGLTELLLGLSPEDGK